MILTTVRIRKILIVMHITERHQDIAAQFFTRENTVDYDNQVILCVMLFSLIGTVSTLVYAYLQVPPVAQFEPTDVTHYRTKTGTYLHCIQGGKSIADLRHARGNYEPGDSKIYDEEA